MRPLRGLSSRPELLLDSSGRALVDAQVLGVPGGQPGVPALPRARVIAALPLNASNASPPQLKPAQVLHDAGLFYLVDPDQNLIGAPAVVVHRLLYAARRGDFYG